MTMLIIGGEGSSNPVPRLMKERSGFGSGQTLFFWPYWIERAISAQRVVNQVVDVIGSGFESFGHSRGDQRMLADVTKGVMLSW
jgi:hypothetical protein